MYNPLYCGCDGIPSGFQYPRIAPSGWNYPCGCNNNPCNNTGCPIQLDFNCSIYHKDNSQINNLGPIGLNNGATLQLFADTVAALLGPIAGPGSGVPTWSLPCLRADYTVNTLQQFAEAVDTQLCQLATDIANVAAGALVPITPVDTNSINLTVSGTLNHTLQADVKISALANNLLSIQADGLFSAPQNLSFDSDTTILSISNGNSVNLSTLACGVGGFLGNVTADPATPLDGQYWFRTDLLAANGLRIQLNGSVRTIPTT